MNTLLFIAYLVKNKEKFSDKNFSLWIIDALRAIHTGKKVTWEISTSFIEYFRVNCEPFLDSLHNFFEKKEDEKSKYLTSFMQKWLIENQLGKYLMNSTYRELQKSIATLYETFDSGSSVVRVFSPRPLSTTQKKSIRDNYKSGVIFLEDPTLIWGMIIYQDSKIVDRSFNRLISRIYSLTN